jgi:YVTN family beta-propeller protein
MMNRCAFLLLVAALLHAFDSGAATAPLNASDIATVSRTAASVGPVSPDSLLLVLNKSDDEAVLVNTSTFEIVGKVPTGHRPHEAAVSTDRGLAYATNYGAQEPGSTITVLDPTTREVKGTWRLEACPRPHGIWTSRDGRLVWVTCEMAEAVLELDAAEGKVLKRWKTDQQGSHMLVPTPDEKKIYVANVGSGTVTSIERATGRTTTIPVAPQSEGIDVSPDGREVWVGSNGAHTLSVIGTAADSVLASFNAGGRVPIRVKFTPDGSQVWVSNAESNSIAVFDARERTKLATIPVGAVPVGILMSPDGRLAFVANTNANQVTVVDVRKRKVLRTIQTGNEPDGMTWWKGAGGG